MTRLHHPVTIPGLLPVPPVPGTILVLDSEGGVMLGGGGGGPGDPPNPPNIPITVDDILTKEPFPTGPLYGGLITITNTNEVTIAAGEGIIVNSWADPLRVTYDKVSWIEQSIDFGPITTRAYSFVYIDPAGTFLFKTSPPFPDELRGNIYMARIVHDLGDGSVVGVRPAHMIPSGTAQMFADFMQAIGVPLLVDGADVIGNASLTFGTTASRWFGPGESWQQDKDDPNIANNPGANPQQFFYMKSNGIVEPAGLTIDVLPARWESPLGTVDDVAAAPNTSTIQRLWTSISGTYVMTYGQIEYANLEDARNAISEDNALFVMPQYLADERATLVAYFVMERSATDLLNGIDVIIISPEGTPVSGGASGPHTHDAVYLRLDAQNDPMQADLDMGAHFINGVLNPVLGQDAATKAYVDGQRDHLLYGNPQHTDVDTAVTLSDRHVLAVPAGLGNWEPELRQNWRGAWIEGTYYKHDVARDGSYLSIANDETTDRPAPQPVSTPAFLLPEAPAWNVLQYTGSIFSGLHIDVPDGTLFEVQAIRVWIQDISASAKYQVVIYDAISDVFNFGQAFFGDTLAAPGWVTTSVTPFFITTEDDFFVLVHNSNTSGTTDFNHPWVRQGDTNQDADPGAGNWSQNNISTRVRISATDDDAVSRLAELTSVVPGSIMRMQDEADPNFFTRYEVVTVTDNTTWVLYDVALSGTGSSGPATIGLRQQIYFEVPIPQPTDYVTLTNFFAGEPNIGGFLSFDEITGGLETDDGYGIDIQLQEYTVSPDWDIMAVTGGTGAGDGGEGTNPLPIGGAIDQALVKASAADYDVEWAGPHLQLSGGVLTGFLTLNADPTDPLHAVTKQYADGAGFSGDHADLTNVLSNQHHDKYTDTEARAAVAGLYLLLTGGTLTNFLTLHADPTVPLHAATKQYVDSEVGGVPPQTFLHDDLTDVISSQHHARYTDAEAVTAVGPHTPPQTFLHNDLTDVVADQHHARYTDSEAVAAVGPHTTLLGDLTDVDVSGVSDLQVLGYNAAGLIWEPKENRSNKGIISLEYLYDANQSNPPASGDVSPNNADPALTTILRISDTDAPGDSVGFVLSNITQGDLIVLAPRNDDSIREDYTVVSSVDQGTWHEITVTYDAHAGTIADNEPVFVYMFQTVPDIDDTYLRLDATNDPLTGDLLLNGAPSLDLHAATKKYVDDNAGVSDHSALTGVTDSQHHTKYTDGEAIAAVGPHFSGIHGDLTLIGTDDHHIKYTDAEAIAAVGPHFSGSHASLTEVLTDDHHTRYTDGEAVLATADHFTQIDAPANPSVGTVWVNPADPPEATYLPLTGGTLTGQLTMDATLEIVSGNLDLHAPSDLQFKDSVGTIQYTFGTFAPDDKELSIWSVPKGERVIRFLESGEIALRPFNSQPVVVEGLTQLEDRLTLTFQPAGAPLMRLEGDGPAGSSRYYEFRRSVDFGQLELWAISSGNVAASSMKWHSDGGGGGAGQAGGNDVFHWGTTHFRVNPSTTDIRFQGIGSFATTGAAANMWCDPANGLWRVSTSARRFKSDIQDGAHLADLVLEPVTFHHDGDDRYHLGFIADDIPDERAITRNGDGDVLNYDVQAILAILAAKVNRLENA